MTRELSKQALQRVGIEMHGGHVDRATVGKLLSDVEPLEMSEKQLVLAEAATLICIDSLKSMGPLYKGFEDHVWMTLSRTADLESLVDSFKSPTKRTMYTESLYYDFLKGMFARSARTRHEFYYEMLTEAGISIAFDSIEFGESAASFHEKAALSMHTEHLLVFYSVELFLKVHMELYPRDSPITEDRLEPFYRHFEQAFPLFGKFDEYTRSDELFKFSACRRRLPLIN